MSTGNHSPLFLLFTVLHFSVSSHVPWFPIMHSTLWMIICREAGFPCPPWKGTEVHSLNKRRQWALLPALVFGRQATSRAVALRVSQSLPCVIVLSVCLSVCLTNSFSFVVENLRLKNAQFIINISGRKKPNQNKSKHGKYCIILGKIGF